MSLAYAHEKFAVAVRLLATHLDNIALNPGRDYE